MKRATELTPLDLCSVDTKHGTATAYSGPWLHARVHTVLGFEGYVHGTLADTLARIDAALDARRPRRLDGSYADERDEV